MNEASDVRGAQIPIADHASWRPFRCPVCEGHRIVSHGFYLYPAGQPFGSTSTLPESCRSCNGTGTVWGHG